MSERQVLQDQVNDLLGHISEVIDIMMECACNEPGVKDYDWIGVSDGFFSTFYTALQLMEKHGYVGAARVRTLFCDEAFSMGAYMATVGWSCEPDAEKSSIMHDRLWETYFTLSALPGAVAACHGEFISYDAESVVATLRRYREELAKDGPENTRARIRTAVENAVNVACIARAVLVTVPFDPKVGKRRACLYDKVDALQTDGAINGGEADALKQAYRLFSKCEHPGPKPGDQDALATLDRTIKVLETRILVKNR
jgi:hypothetical protein